MLLVRSRLIDGEAAVGNENALDVFDLIREYRPDAAAMLCAFNLIDQCIARHQVERIAAGTGSPHR